jgi:hypothetical protein
VRAIEPQSHRGKIAVPWSGAAQASAGYDHGTASIIAEFSDYGSMLLALRTCRETRNISFETLDEIVGAPKGYFSKVFAPQSERKITMQAMGWALAGLGVKCQIVDDPAMLKQIANRLKKRDEKVVRRGATHVVFSHRFLRKIGAKGGRRAAQLQRQRKAQTLNARLARWRGRNGDRQ